MKKNNFLFYFYIDGILYDEKKILYLVFQMEKKKFFHINIYHLYHKIISINEIENYEIIKEDDNIINKNDFIFYSNVLKNNFIGIDKIYLDFYDFLLNINEEKLKILKLLYKKKVNLDFIPTNNLKYL